MHLEIKPILERSEWEDFMEIAQPHTFLHSWNWGSFNAKMGNTIFRLGVFDGEKCVAAVLILKIKARRGSFLFCPHGPSFSPDSAKEDVMKVLTEYLKILGKKEHCAFLRFSPLLEKNAEHQKIFEDLKFREAPIHMQHPELAWMLDVTVSEEEILKNMRKTTRYCIKKAEKDGVEIVMSANPEDVEIFWKVYKETFGRQNFTPFSKEYLRSEMEIFDQGQALFFFAQYNGEVVATALIVFCGDSAFYHHGASIHKYPKITAPYLLQWAVIQEAKKRGCHWYDFWGVVGDDQPKHPWAGLSLFKKGFGGSSREYVHAKDLALSPKYWVSYVVETVRRKKRGL